MNKFKIGEFEMLSGNAIVSDPCYELGTWCQADLARVKKGLWSVYVIIMGEGRVGALLAFADKSEQASRAQKWEEMPAEIGVDSGQAGIFDAKHYRNDAIVKSVTRVGPEIICDDEPWYSICCDRTLNTEHSAGVIPFGCVSSSGYGDGSYRCYIQKDEHDYVSGIKIEFISEEA